MIILSVPYRDKHSLLRVDAADLTEYRLDYCPDPQNIDFSAFDEDSILTFKGADDNPDIRRKMLHTRALVDVDYNDYCGLPGDVDKSRLIISLHTKSFDSKRIEQLLRLPGDFFALKIVFEAKSFEEILLTQAMTESSGNPRVIFNVTGPYAAFQRPLYRFFSSMAVYLYDRESTYPGQLSLAQFQAISGTGIHESSSIYGIIGGAQVSASYSLEAYNRFFLEQGNDAHYLPIPAQDSEEAISIVKWLKQHFVLGGLSVTSPLKCELPLSLGVDGTAINTIRFRDVPIEGYQYIPALSCYARSINTDICALRESLARLQVSCENSIFIYGSGACAEAFINELMNCGYHSISLGGRNPKRVSYLRTRYSLSPSVPTFCHLLINASSRLSFDADSDLTHFDKLIELPYQRERLSDLQKLAMERNLPHISGLAFFKLQHLAQRAFLLD